MSDIVGKNIKLTIVGTSHGPYTGVTIDGLPSGLKVNENSIKRILHLRNSLPEISSSRREENNFEIISGVFNNRTSGDCLTIIIPNNNICPKDYDNLKYCPRPSHADYTQHVKYKDFSDPRGGGHFSGRLTIPMIAAGAILKDALLTKGIVIGSRIKQIGSIEDNLKEITSCYLLKLCNDPFPATSKELKSNMIDCIKESREKGDSVGGILETTIIGVPAGIGEPYFDSVESVLSHLIFSVGGVKGIEFGSGFAITKLLGSEANDQLIYTNEKINTLTNHNGGINGGISNGMPIIVKTAIKPTPSISKEQNTVNYETGKSCQIKIEGRHDPCIVHKARFAIEALIAFGITDLLISEKGRNWLRQDS